MVRNRALGEGAVEEGLEAKLGRVKNLQFLSPR